MHSPTRASIVALVLGVAMVAVLAAVAERRHERLPDVLDAPALVSEQASNSTVSGIARRGERLVGVGPGGKILLSVDGGGSWKQVPAPVSADLVSVKFTDDRVVWAVGHDAVALRSTDGGASWERVLDGRSVLKLLESVYGEHAAKGDASAKGMLDELSRSVKQSATPGVLPAPFLDLWIGAEGEGYLVGAFGLLLRTVDGGKTWQPWTERADNDKRFHLYGVTASGNNVYLVGEQGLVLTLDRQQQRFVRLTTPYAGTFFGIDAAPGRLVAFGLRGNAYVSRDDGRQWQRIETRTDAHIVAAVRASPDQLLLVSQVGEVLALNDADLKAQSLQVPFTSEVLGAALAGSRGLAFAQINGVRLIELAGRPQQ